MAAVEWETFLAWMIELRRCGPLDMVATSEEVRKTNLQIFILFSGEPQILKRWKLFCFAWMKSLTRCEQVSSIFKACGSWKSENRFFCMKEKMDKVWEPKLQSNGLLLPPSWKPPPEKCPTIEICCRRKSWHLLRGSFSILMEKNMGTKVWPLD